MLHKIIKLLLYIAIKGYFRSITIKNRDKVPIKGPVIFAANHPGSLLDAFVIATHLKRKVYVMARGESFKGNIADFLFPKLGMIPIYRPSKLPNEAYKNVAIFQKCFDHLKQQGAILIFSEGVSKLERRIRPLKTGTARIALGAEAQNGFKLGLKIVAVGVNYSNPHVFQGDLLINFSPPFSLEEYFEDYQKDEFGTVNNLTARLQKELEEKTIVIHNEQLDQLISKIELIYRSHLQKDQPLGISLPEENYRISKEIVDAVEYFYNKDRKRVSAIKKQLDTYLRDLQYFHIQSHLLEVKTGRQHIIVQLLFLILTFPLFLAGLLNNYLPFKLSGILARKFAKEDIFKGGLQLVFGMICFLIFYLLIALLLGRLINLGASLMYLLLLYPLGMFLLLYLKLLEIVKTKLRLRWISKEKSGVMAYLNREREAIIAALEKGKEEYLAYRKA